MFFVFSFLLFSIVSFVNPSARDLLSNFFASWLRFVPCSFCVSFSCQDSKFFIFYFTLVLQLIFSFSLSSSSPFLPGKEANLPRLSQGSQPSHHQGSFSLPLLFFLSRSLVFFSHFFLISFFVIVTYSSPFFSLAEPLVCPGGPSPHQVLLQGYP